MRNAQESVHLVAATVGFISLVLLWLTVCWGSVLRSGWAWTRLRHATSYGVHRTCALLGLCLAAVHALAQLAVPGGPVRWLDEALPFLNRKDPVGLGLGVLALELMLALALSVLVQRRLGYHRWRWLHLAAYPAFALLLGHVLLAGSDVDSAWVRRAVLAGCGVVVVLWLATTRVVAALPRRLASAVSSRSGTQLATVHVDPTRCARFGFCEHEAPEVFRLRSDGLLTYRPTVPDGQVDGVLRAVSACPARAIMLGRTASAVVMPPVASPPVPAGAREAAGAPPSGATLGGAAQDGAALGSTGPADAGHWVEPDRDPVAGSGVIAGSEPDEPESVVPGPMWPHPIRQPLQLDPARPSRVRPAGALPGGWPIRGDG